MSFSCVEASFFVRTFVMFGPQNGIQGRNTKRNPNEKKMFAVNWWRLDQNHKPPQKMEEGNSRDLLKGNKYRNSIQKNISRTPCKR